MKPLPKRGQSGTLQSVPAAAESVTVAPHMDRTLKAPRFRGRMIGAAIGTVAVLGAGAFLYTSYVSSPVLSVSEGRLTFSAVQQTAFGEAVSVTGTLIPEETVFLDTVEGGRVTAVLVEEGAVVAAGAPLATLQNSDLELQVMAREAQYIEQLSSLARAEIEFDQTRLSYDRQLEEARLRIDLTKADLQRRLPREKTGVPQSDIDRLQAELASQERLREMILQARDRDRANAEQNLSQLRNSMQRMKDGLDIMRGNLANLAITAPVDGQVSLLDIRPGEVLAPGARVGQVDGLDRFKVRALVDEFYLGRIAIGQEASVTLAGREHVMKVHRISPKVENRTFEVDLVFEDDLQGSWSRGQSVRPRLRLGDDESTLTIASGAFYEDTGGLWVFVLSPDGETLSRRDVVLGRRNSERIEVISGLTEGEQVLTSSYDLYLGQTRVRLKQNS